MSSLGLGEDSHQVRRHRVGLMAALVVVAVLIALAVVLAVRALIPESGHITLSLYNSDRAEQFSAQVQYDCGDRPCGREGDRLFFIVSGGGVQPPSEARVGSSEITEAVIREQADGLLVYYPIPEGEPGYSIIDFPCSTPGGTVHVEAVIESGNGESQASSTGAVECPSL